MQITINPTEYHNISCKSLKKRASKRTSMAIEQDLTKIFDKYSSQQEGIHLFEILNNDFIKKLARKLSQSPTTAIKIGLTGESDSGKSTFFRWIQEHLLNKHNIESGVLSRDCYMNDYSEQVKAHGNYNNLSLTGVMEGSECVDFKRIIDDMKRLEKGYIAFPKKRIRESGIVIEQDFKNPIYPSRLIMVEGISLFHNKDFRKDLDIAIYAETTPEIIKGRWFSRAGSRGKTGTVADKCFELAKEKAKIYTLPYKQTSDIVYNTESKKEIVNAFIDDLVHFLKKCEKK